MDTENHSISIGRIYEVHHERMPLVVQIVRPLSPNGQGHIGPMRWIGKCICALDTDPVKEGDDVEFLATDIIRLATKQELVRRCLLQGWKEIKDIVAYLADYGVVIGYGTVSCYKSYFLHGRLKAAANQQRASKASSTSSSFGVEDVQLWDRFVERLGGRSRAKAFLHFLRAIKKI